MINPYRMMARMQCATQAMLKEYALSVSQMPANYRDLIAALAMRLQGVPQSMCIDLFNAYNDAENRASTMSMTQAEIDQEWSDGTLEGKYIVNHFPVDYVYKVISQEDYLPDALEAEAKRKRVLKIVGLSVAGAIVLAVIASWIYNLEYFREQRAFDEIENVYAYNSSYVLESHVRTYCNEFPEGKHLEEVMFYDVTKNNEEHNSLRTFDAIDRYLAKFPSGGAHSAECAQMHADIWQKEVDRYRAAIGDTISEGEQYMLNMLEYMKEHNIRTVAVTYSADIELKNFDEYPETVRKAFDPQPDALIKTKFLTVAPVKGEITAHSANEWTQAVTHILDNGFDKILSTNFITFTTTADSTDTALPRVIISYTVKNTEERAWGYTFPVLWTVKHNADIKKLLSCEEEAMIGISLDFKADFVTPGVDQPFVITAQGDPGDATIQFHTAHDAYRTMSERCLKSFTTQIATDFGFKE